MEYIEKMIPLPKCLCTSGEYFVHGTTISGDFPMAAECFKNYVKKVHDLDFTEGNDFIVSLDESLEKGEYAILSGSERIEIKAGGSEGARYAFASLIQLIENREGKAALEAFEMRDKADNPYRGLMVDCARKHHPLAVLKRYVDLCWFYKIRMLHLHLSDSEAYTLPSKILPKATSEHNHYTEEEIAELVEYAYLRDIQLVPEVDSPGHTWALFTAYPEFSAKKRVLCVHEETVSAMQEVYRELCDMFPYSEYIHIGADESTIMDWNECEECVSYAERVGIKAEEFDEQLSKPKHRAERILVHYINKMAEAIVEKGRKPIVWEGFSREVNPYVTRDITVMTFESFYQLASTCIKDGFKVINSSWAPTYLVVPNTFWSKEDCYKWDIGTFSAIHPDSPYYGGYFRMNEKTGIQGGQLNSWGDVLKNLGDEGLSFEFEKIRDNLPAIAENTWNNEKQGDFAEFEKAYSYCAKLFDKILE